MPGAGLGSEAEVPEVAAEADEMAMTNISSGIKLQCGLFYFELVTLDKLLGLSVTLFPYG